MPLPSRRYFLYENDVELDKAWYKDVVGDVSIFFVALPVRARMAADGSRSLFLRSVQSLAERGSSSVSLLLRLTLKLSTITLMSAFTSGVKSGAAATVRRSPLPAFLDFLAKTLRSAPLCLLNMQVLSLAPSLYLPSNNKLSTSASRSSATPALPSKKPPLVYPVEEGLTVSSTLRHWARRV
jgi:hypothetical protein